MKKYIILLYSIIICSYSCNKFAEEKLRKTSYNGIIESKYKDKINHNVNMFYVNGGEHSFNVSAYLFHGAFDYGQAGDSIIKKEGTMKILIKKKDGNSRLFNFSY